jgi:DNA-binding transcriptional ArsR family regulator
MSYNQELLQREQNEIISIFNTPKLLILLNIFQCQDDTCGCDLAGDLGMSKNLISYHIRTLKESGYLKEERRGRNKIYKIPTPKLAKVKQILEVLELI